MKKLIAIAAAMLLVAFTASAQKSIRVPSGYAGMVEEENTFHFNGEDTSIAVSMTHGVYYTPNVFVGLGFAFEGSNDYFIMPVFASTRYIFNEHAKVSPMFSARLGSYVGDDLGAYGEAAFGLRFASSSKFAFALSLVGKYISDLECYEYHANTSSEYVDKNFSGIGIRFSIEW
jgi:hypothetical protein